MVSFLGGWLCEQLGADGRVALDGDVVAPIGQRGLDQAPPGGVPDHLAPGLIEVGDPGVELRERVEEPGVVDVGDASWPDDPHGRSASGAFFRRASRSGSDTVTAVERSGERTWAAGVARDLRVVYRPPDGGGYFVASSFLGG